MATSLAAEQRVAMVSLNGADVFSRYLGESERMVREAFRRARAQRPCVVHLDEVDALAPVRRMYGGSASEGSGSASGGSQVEERVVSALLTEMDGVEALQGVYVIAATARPERVDSALLRPGRLEVHIELPAPDLESRERILAGLLAQCATADDVRPAELAACTQGLTGADLRRLCEEAGLCSLRVHVGPPDEAQLTRASLVEALAACFGRALW
jgi:transitional endoplasmic reticulum ATPase